MSDDQPPPTSSIQDLGADKALRNTWKHFYAVEQAWERVFSADVAALRAEGEESAGQRRSDGRALPVHLPRRFRVVASRHHDDHYSPAYRAALENPETRWARHTDEPHNWQALAPNSILVSVADASPCFVITAFRPTPGLRGVLLDEGPLREYALDYFLRKTGLDR